MRRWPEREIALLVRCQECHCLSEHAADWIAKIVEDDEEPDFEPYVVLYCPSGAEFDRSPKPIHLTFRLRRRSAAFRKRSGSEGPKGNGSRWPSAGEEENGENAIDLVGKGAKALRSD